MHSLHPLKINDIVFLQYPKQEIIFLPGMKNIKEGQCNKKTYMVNNVVIPNTIWGYSTIMPTQFCEDTYYFHSRLKVENKKFTSWK